MDFTLALPDEICTELGLRARARRLALNWSVAEMALRIGVSEQTLSHFERTGKSNLLTFVRILEVLNASQELQAVLQAPTNSIEAMRAKAAQPVRQRAYNSRRSGKISSETGSETSSEISSKICPSDPAKRASKTRKTP